MWTNNIPKQSRGRADSEYVSSVGVDGKGVEFTGRKQTRSLQTYNLSVLTATLAGEPGLAG